MKHFHHKTFIDEAKVAMQIALFKEKDMHHVASTKDKTSYGVYILLASALLNFLGQMFFSRFHPTLIGGIVMALIQVVMMIAGIYLLSFIAQRLFNGKGKHDGFFRVMAYAGIVGWLTLIPFLGFVSGLWSLALLFVILKTVHKLTTAQSILTIIISVIILLILAAILSPVSRMGGWGYGWNSGYGHMPMMNNNDFRMDFTDEDGGGSIQMEDGKMRFESDDGQKFEMNIPQ